MLLVKYTTFVIDATLGIFFFYIMYTKKNQGKLDMQCFLILIRYRISIFSHSYIFVNKSLFKFKFVC